MLDEHQDIQPPQQHGVHVQEIDRDDPGGLGCQELPPRGVGPTRRRIDARSPQDLVGLEYTIVVVTCSFSQQGVACAVPSFSAAEGRGPAAAEPDEYRRPRGSAAPGFRTA
jgi:hypothetical protein